MKLIDTTLTVIVIIALLIGMIDGATALLTLAGVYVISKIFSSNEEKK